MKNRFADLGVLLRFKKEFLNDVLSGRKNVTIRWGIVRIRFSDVLIVCENYAYAIATIDKVDYVRLRELPKHVIKAEGFKSLQDLASSLRKIYPKISLDSYVTIVYFRIKEVFERPLRIEEALSRLGYR